MLRVCVAALLFVVVAAHTIPDEPLSQHVAFIKFFKVGGTSVADTLGRLAVRDGRKICCGQTGCDMCYTHDTLNAWKKHGRRAFPHNTTLVTLLRHPVEREISRYYYDRARGERKANVEGLGVWSLGVRNQYAQVLGGGNAERTIEVLDNHFTLVGVTERMHEFVVALGLTLRQAPASMAYGHLKRMVGRPTQEQVSEQALRNLYARLEPDIRIYNHSLAAFQLTWDSVWPEDVRQEYSTLLDEARPNITCHFGAYNGAPKLVGNDCIRAPVVNKMSHRTISDHRVL